MSLPSGSAPVENTGLAKLEGLLCNVLCQILGQTLSILLLITPQDSQTLFMKISIHIIIVHWWFPLASSTVPIQSPPTAIVERSGLTLLMS